jgi:2-succinyl-5-enolpyruvyl-6-hydroxy-3-cyclohexene-1-carboxylate synthase
VGDARATLRWCTALVRGLQDGGVRRVVLSPGSRSTPLVLACTQMHRLRLHVLLDERSAAFFALGLMKAEDAPVAVLATSGSAPANWYPALIEAAQDDLPLVLISADRPAELQGCGANQTADQVQLFGRRVRGFFQAADPADNPEALRYARALGVRAVDRSRRPWPGPVHVNVPLREPLVPDGPWPDPGPGDHAQLQPVRIEAPIAQPDPDLLASLGRQLAARRGVIVCGRGRFAPGFAEALTHLAGRLGAPLFADPLSGLRFGGHDRSGLLTRYDAFLRAPGAARALRPEWLLQLGGLPVSKALLGYMETAGETLVAAPHGPWADQFHRASRVLYGDPEAVCRGLAAELAPGSGAESAWLQGFLSRERACRDALAAMTAPPLEAEVMAVLERHCPEGSRLFCANSMSIRDADSFLAGSERRIRLVGNRGVSGIDGNVSTVLGLAAADGGPVVGLLGDLALLHDAGGLQAAGGVDAVLVVFNNGGGAIFGYLPQARLPGFEAYWLTPAGLDLERLAQLYRIGFRRARDATEFEDALAAVLRASGVSLIEVVVDREQSLARHRAYWAAAADREVQQDD